jgi:hypothetical protein
MTQINLNDIAKSLLEVAERKHSHVQPPLMHEVKRTIHDIRTLLLPEYFMVGDDIAEPYRALMYTTYHNLKQQIKAAYAYSGDTEADAAAVCDEFFSRLPELQRLLAEIWATGDTAAAEIYDRGAEELWNGIKVTAEKLGLSGTAYPVSYSGGLFKAGECALAPLRKRIEKAGAKLVDPALSPEVGALIMAIRHKHPDIDLHNFCIHE